MSIYIVTSNDESVTAYSTKEGAMESLKYVLDDDDGAGWNSDYYNNTFKSFMRSEYEIPVGGSLHVEGGVTHLWHVKISKSLEEEKESRKQFDKEQRTKN